MIQRSNKSPCKNKGSPIPKICCVQQSAGKIMATVFWDSEGVLLLEFMPHKTIITEDTYASTMVVLRENIKQNRRGNLTASVLLIHGNAHKSRTSRAAIRKCGFLELKHPPYSPDLAPSDFLFRILKTFLRGRRFSDDNAVKEAVSGYFDTQDVSFYFLTVFDHWR